MQCMTEVMINGSEPKEIAHSLITSYRLASKPILKMTMEKKDRDDYSPVSATYED